MASEELISANPIHLPTQSVKQLEESAHQVVDENQDEVPPIIEPFNQAEIIPIASGFGEKAIQNTSMVSETPEKDIVKEKKIDPFEVKTPSKISQIIDIRKKADTLAEIREKVTPLVQETLNHPIPLRTSVKFSGWQRFMRWIRNIFSGPPVKTWSTEFNTVRMQGFWDSFSGWQNAKELTGIDTKRLQTLFLNLDEVNAKKTEEALTLIQQELLSLNFTKIFNPSFELYAFLQSRRPDLSRKQIEKLITARIKLEKLLNKIYEKYPTANFPEANHPVNLAQKLAADFIPVVVRGTSQTDIILQTELIEKYRALETFYRAGSFRS